MHCNCFIQLSTYNSHWSLFSHCVARNVTLINLNKMTKDDCFFLQKIISNTNMNNNEAGRSLVDQYFIHAVSKNSFNICHNHHVLETASKYFLPSWKLGLKRLMGTWGTSHGRDWVNQHHHHYHHYNTQYYIRIQVPRVLSRASFIKSKTKPFQSTKCQSPGAVWKSRWPSWAPRP